MIYSILIGAVIYILVQVAFIGALSPSLLAESKTWATLGVPGQSPAIKALNAAPFYQVAKVAGLGWLAVILRIDAVVSPVGTGLIYLTSSSRISYGLSKNGYIPDIFEKNSPRTKVPVIGVVITAVIGLLFLLPFPSWKSLVNVVTSASVMMYAGAPLAMGALRRQKPDLPRAYKLPFGEVLAPVGFILANFIVYWSGWQTYSTLMVVMLIGFALMLVSGLFHLNPNQPRVDWEAAIWVFPYLIGMGAISYFGGFGKGGIIGGVGVFKTVWIGGRGGLRLYWDLLVLALFSVAIYYLAMWQRLSPEKVDEYVRDVYPPPITE